MKKMIIIVILFLLTGCTLPGLNSGKRDERIIIAGGSTTERQILAEISKQMIEHYVPELNVELINNLGSSILIYQSIIRNDADISSAMYTGTSLTGELKMTANTNAEEAYNTVVKQYYKRFDMVWFPSYGFDNTYAFMVTQEFANEHNLTKVSDLKDISSQLKAGIDPGWIDRKGDGYEAFKEMYGFDFGTVSPMRIGLVYAALQTKDMDVVLGYSTDGRVDSYNLVTLEDDLSLFPAYDASPVLSKKILDKYPELEQIFLRLENAIDSKTMQRLNRISDEDLIEPQIVARDFLREADYFSSLEVGELKDRPLYQDIFREGGK